MKRRYAYFTKISDLFIMKMNKEILITADCPPAKRERRKLWNIHKD